MAERIEAWWARRQFSRGLDVPYEVGACRDAWAPYPVLVRQYRPELNAGIMLSQIPPAADVLLLWHCDVGHLFVATPSEQRGRPGGRRRRSVWCPECASGARPRRIAPMGSVAVEKRARSARPLCDKTPRLPVGEAFRSVCAPKPASAAEERVRAALVARLTVTSGMNAVRVSRAFFNHIEVWPDILLPELWIAVEYDTTGRHGLKHVGTREKNDRRKDRTLREAGWEVVRLRTGKLQPLGPHDLQLPTVGARGIERLIDVLREIRGPLLVDAYLG